MSTGNNGSGDQVHPHANVEDVLMRTSSELAPSDDGKSVVPSMLIAMYSFEASEPGELSFDIGDIVKVLDRGPDWSEVQRVGDNAVGFVPNNYFNPHVPAPLPVQDEPPQADPAPTHLPPVYAISTDYDPRTNRLGDELAEDSDVWPIYVNTAIAHDGEMVNGWNRTLDVLLIFAPLLSAIVTTFVIASSTLLQPDYSQVNALLSAHILNALTNGGNVSYITSIPSPEQILAFEMSTSNQVVNILWFAALGFSLASVLVVMLAKQWLNAYMSEQKAVPHESACERQRRFDGLYQWSFPRIMTLLPALLHASLFLFLIGLIIYMWQLDPNVSTATCIILGMLFIFYFGTGATAVFSASCPYITPISQSLRSFLPITNTSARFPRDLLVSKAIMWLSSARDPKTVDTALQSLAGLRRRFVGYNREQAESLAMLALERLRGCFIPEWRQGVTYSLRTEMLYDASCYSRTLMNFVDDSRNLPGEFAIILEDRTLPIFMQLLGNCSHPSMALLALCDNHRLLHRKELERWLSVRNRDGSHNVLQAGKFIRREPAINNTCQILQRLGDLSKGVIFIQSFAIEIAIEVLGFCPLSWVVAVSMKELLLNQILSPLLLLQREMRDGNAGIRRAMACTLFIFAKVHAAVRLPDATDDVAMRFETALLTIATIENGDQSEYTIREMLLHALSYFCENYEQESTELTVKSIFDELCHETDRRSGTEDPTFSDKLAIRALLPLLRASLNDDQKNNILTRLQANAVSAAPGFNLGKDSLLFRVTPRDPFPPETVSILIAALETYKTLTVTWLRDTTILLYLVTQNSTHRQKILAKAAVVIELIRDLASEEVANHLFWIFTDVAQQSISASNSDTMIALATAGVLSMVNDFNMKYGLTPADVHAWVGILHVLPVVPQETPTRRELVQLMYAGVENQDPSESQKLQDLREPLLQFSVQPLTKYSRESALGVLQHLRDTYSSSVASERVPSPPLQPHTVVPMDI